MASLIYIASPYSHGNPAVRALRYEQARLTAINLLREGLPAFSPIVYGREMEKAIGTDYVSWKLLNDAMLESAASMLVLMLDGWEDSAGVKYELEFAKKRGLPVSYIDPPEINR